MGKKKKNKEEPSEMGGRNGKRSLEFLSATFENVDLQTVKRHILYLIAISILTKLVVLFVTPVIFHSFIDYFDLGVYLNHAVMLTQGQIPYVNYSFDYPILVFVPITIALVPALAFQNAMAFVYTFQFLMVLCDILTLICIYFIALKIYNEETAFLSGLIYATAFSTSYFVLTKYDAFPTCLLVLAVVFTIYGMNMKGYIAAGLGFFTKIFPAIAFPFLILYNTKKSSIKDEIIAVLKVMVPLSLVLLLPVLIIRPEAIQTYLFATGASVGVYVNTATYTLYSWFSGVGHIAISPENVSLVMYGLMGITVLYLLYNAYMDTEKRPVTLLKTLLCALIAIIVFTKFHSPQYIVWFTPFLCLLVADDIYKVVLFFIVQIFAYIEFPLMFGSFYTNLKYTNGAGSSGWYLTLFFFTLQYLALLILVFAIIRPKEGLLKTIRKRIPQ
ncbi:MAG: hypothetical protein ABR887_06555 [Methanoregulaceae archaeon]